MAILRLLNTNRLWRSLLIIGIYNIVPARRLINLLPQDDLTASPAGKFLLFFLNLGRYVVIFTELVVIVAFITSLVLDYQKRNLEDEIDQKIQFLDANYDFEKEFRFTQGRLTEINSLLSKQFGSKNVIDRFTPLISSEITISKILISTDSIRIDGSSRSALGLGQTVYAFKNATWLSGVTITNVSTGGNTGGEIKFSLAAQIKKVTIRSDNT
ncbi:MAG: hypothetical protein UW69_C0025G0003 [Microgenomates group bacterium GW2011_GWA2_44_7]|nr:MAG: hypothetical protein UW69_C0025G0003 [Microgenomates group bacterium GW2011_GWA2_44_7]KKT78599.1 MAG: hypothetical protein UW73_C0001G0046 [Microgenomates group bacterium GW2011_GWB1_44_8]